MTEFANDPAQLTVSPDYNYITVSYDSNFLLFNAADYARNHRLPVDVTHLYCQDKEAFWTAMWVPKSDKLVLCNRNFAAVSKAVTTSSSAYEIQFKVLCVTNNSSCRPPFIIPTIGDWFTPRAVDSENNTILLAGVQPDKVCHKMEY